MAAVFRVKRRNDDEPIDSLLVACKKRKIGSDEADAEAANPFSTVVKFVGTVNDPDQNVMDHITKKLTKEELKANYKQRIVNITDKVRQETKESSAENRFKVINRFRSINNSKSEDTDVEEITVIDVENTASCAEKSESPDDKNNFVYDLYYLTGEAVDEEYIDFIEKFNERLMSDAYRESGVYDSDNDSEDSNAESHWKNDYPDSDYSDNSVLEDDMKHAVDRLKIDGEESDLSTDDDDFAYGLEKPDKEFTKFFNKFVSRMRNHCDEGDDDDEDGDYVLNSSKSDSSETNDLDYYD